MARDSHIPDHDLIAALDAELDAAGAARVRDHLEQCWTCRARRAELESVIADFARAHRSAIRDSGPSAGPAAKLRAAMSGAPQSRWRTLAWPAVATAAAVVMGALALSGPRAAAGPLPNARLTPGATRSVLRDQVCVATPDDDRRAVPSQLAHLVFAQYRITPSPKTYEVDYLISPGLGGADDIRNLWPQPYAAGQWNSRVKDALEDHLRQLVCQGRMDLADAQHEIATDWIAAYQRHFRTRSPLPAHALFVKDQPWE